MLMSPDNREKHADSKDVMRRSFEKETSVEEHAHNEARTQPPGRRSVLGAPTDPNSPTTEANIPPGVAADEARDPGRMTPGSAPVDNRDRKSTRLNSSHVKISYA